MIEYKIQNVSQDIIRCIAQSQYTHLENCMYTNNLTCQDETHSVQEGECSMAQSRVRVMTGTDKHGLPIYKWISGSTQDERNDNIVKEYYNSGRLWEVIGVSPVDLILQSNNGNLSISQQEPTKKHLFSTFAWEYYKRFKEPNIANNTKVREKSFVRTLCAAFGDLNIEDITPNDIQDFINDKAAAGTSLATVQGYIVCLRTILNAAVEDKIRSDNPAKSSKITVNGRKTNGTEALSLECIKSIISHIPFITDKRTQLFLALLCLTGMRREEVLGLQWGDIDFKRKQIHVQRAITYPGGILDIKCTKSNAGNRYIPIPDKLIKLLKAYPKANTEYKDYVLLSKNGTLFTSFGVDNLLENVRKELNLPNITAKTFRTTFATMMVATNSITPKELQTIMGHSNITTTMDIYAKVEQTMLAAKHNVLVDFINSVSDKSDDENK